MTSPRTIDRQFKRADKAGKVIVINGEELQLSEAKAILEMIRKDAIETAGVYHGMNRSEKFRINWPDEDLFAEANWKTFVAAVRAMYAEKLADPKTKPEDARKMHQALVLQQMMAQNQEADSRLQLAPNTLQFEGDPIENMKIKETYGNRPNLRAAYLNGAAKLARMN